MSDKLREAIWQAIKALDADCDWTVRSDAIDALRAALAEPQPAVPADDIAAGALYDFMGYLTTRPERLVLSSTDDAAPAAEAIVAFLRLRGLEGADAAVTTWQAHMRAAYAPPAEQARAIEAAKGEA